jgi:hypothetical protein
MWNSHVPVPGILWLFTIPAPTLWPCTASKRWSHEIFRSFTGVLIRKNSLVLKAQTLEKVLKWVHIPYILAGYLQIDADPDPVYKF